MKLIKRTAVFQYSMALAIALGAACSSLVHADEPGRPPDQTDRTAGLSRNTGSTLEEIVVTAQKREQKIMDVGLTIAAVTNRQLTNAGVTDISRLTEVVSGLSIAATYDNVPVFSIRGLGFNANQLAAAPTVAAYIDEAPLPYLAMTGGVMLDIERAEVVKGPQGTLYGNNSTGGSINFIAAKPTAVLSGGGTINADRFGQLSAEGFISGPLSQSVKVRLAVSSTQGGAWQHSYTPGPELTNGNANKGIERLIIEWQASDRLKVSLTQNAYYDKSDPQVPQLAMSAPAGGPGSAYVDPTYGSIETYPLPPHDNRAADFATPPRKNEVLNQEVLRADFDLNDTFKITSLTNYAHYKRIFYRDLDATRIPIIYAGHNGTIETYGEELRATGDFRDIGLNVIGGVNYAESKTHEENPYDLTHLSVYPVPLTLNQFSDFNSKTPAVFGNAEWKASDQITLIGGARYTEDKQTYDMCLPANPSNIGFLSGLANIFRGANGLGPTSAYSVGKCATSGPAPTFLPFEYTPQSTDKNVSWRGGVNYKPIDDVLLYALVSHGVKAGGYPFLVAILSNQLNKVRPEQVTDYESGVKYSVSNRLSLTGSVYYYNYRDKQILALVPLPIVGPGEVLTNIPKSKAYGFDLEATVVPVNGLTLHGAITYTKTSIIDPGPVKLDGFARPIDYRGHPFAYAPLLSGIFDVEYRAPVSESLDWIVGMNGMYSSTQFGAIDATPEFKVPTRTVLDARIGVESISNWKATIWVRNLTNKYYWTDISFAGDGEIKDTGLPRNFGITLGHRF